MIINRSQVRYMLMHIPFLFSCLLNHSYLLFSDTNTHLIKTLCKTNSTLYIFYLSTCTLWWRVKDYGIYLSFGHVLFDITAAIYFILSFSSLIKYENWCLNEFVSKPYVVSTHGWCGSTVDSSRFKLITDVASVSTICRLDLGTVPTVWHFFS
jgi:hypothetical protein